MTTPLQSQYCMSIQTCPWISLLSAIRHLYFFTSNLTDERDAAIGLCGGSRNRS